MPNSLGISRPRAATAAPTTPTVYNVPVALAATEEVFALTPNTKKFTIKVRGFARLQLAFAVGESATDFLTIPPGASYTASGVAFSGTLYFQVSKPTQIVEIVEWV